ncbi:hypothetical protein Q9L58_010701, partial [Maublancomyces gigas]
VANTCLEHLDLNRSVHDEIDRLPALSKFDFYLRVRFKGKSIDRSSQYVEWLRELKRLRDGLVHLKPHKVEWVGDPNEELSAEAVRTKNLDIAVNPKFWDQSDAIKNMIDKLLEPLFKALESGNWGIVFVVVAIALVFNLRPIFEFFERREGRREDFVKEALKIEGVASVVRSLLEEELNYLLFKKVTGIAANQPLRDKLKDIVDRSAGEIQTSQLARAKSHIKMQGGKLHVTTSAFDKAEWLFNWAFAIAMAVFAVAFFMLPSAIKGITFQQLGSLMGLGVLFFLFALFLVSQTIPYSTARRLQPLIAKLEGSGPNDDG